MCHALAVKWPVAHCGEDRLQATLPLGLLGAVEEALKGSVSHLVKNLVSSRNRVEICLLMQKWLP